MAGSQVPEDGGPEGSHEGAVLSGQGTPLPPRRDTGPRPGHTAAPIDTCRSARALPTRRWSADLLVSAAVAHPLLWHPFPQDPNLWRSMPNPCSAWGLGRDALEGKGPERGPRQRLDRRLEGVAEAVGRGYRRLQIPALAVRETVAGHRLGTLEGGGWGTPPLPMHPWGLGEGAGVRTRRLLSDTGGGAYIPPPRGCWLPPCPPPPQV